MTEIIVRGLGGGINFEMQVIEKALKDAGCIVIVQNDAADWVCSRGENYVEDRIKKNFSDPEKAVHVSLVAKHIPWGG